MDEVERLAEMERQRRQREAEQRLVEEETAKRIEELVTKRVEEELEKRKDEIEREVAKRVEEAKQIMEKQMMEEMERRKERQLQEEKHREVSATSCALSVRRPVINCVVTTAQSAPFFTNILHNVQMCRPHIHHVRLYFDFTAKRKRNANKTIACFFSG